MTHVTSTSDNKDAKLRPWAESEMILQRTRAITANMEKYHYTWADGDETQLERRGWLNCGEAEMASVCVAQRTMDVERIKVKVMRNTWKKV